MPGERKFAIKAFEEKFAEGIVVIKSANNEIHNENGNGY